MASAAPVGEEARHASAATPTAVGVVQPVTVPLQYLVEVVATSTRQSSPFGAGVGDKGPEAIGCAATGAEVLQGEGTQVCMQSWLYEEDRTVIALC
jgi:hypothetical protein